MWPLVAKIFCTALFLIALRKYRWFYILYRTYKRDFRWIVMIFKMLRIISKNKRLAKPSYYHFNQVVKKYPHKVAFLFEGESWTFTDVKEFTDKIATYFQREGYKKGDSIALLLGNCPEYPCIWLGLSQIGVTTALINTNLVHHTLIHSLEIAKCKAIIFEDKFRDSIASSITNHLNIKCYQYNRKSKIPLAVENWVDLSNEIRSTTPNVAPCTVDTSHPLVYIYTSGTTGLPKAAILTHKRFCMFQALFMALYRSPEKITLYTPMPFYHGGGGIIGCGHALLCGSTVAIRSKFSASNYWKDCIKYNCNAGQYIGEMCRYILASCPEGNLQHPVKSMIGNGLRGQLWNEFQQKYGINRILELYASTEGNFMLINIDNKPGSVGFVPPYLQPYWVSTLVKYSEETGEPVRNENGFCTNVDKNEPGLAICSISSKPKITDSAEYVGYVNPVETKKKILRNVFIKGDQYFNTGDVLSSDEFGYYYFVDRLGDTFRWKGENVSTSEVESVVSKIIGLKDAIVYGVQIPGSEGRAGMASIVCDHSTLDLDLALKQFKQYLPSYAIPLFIRFKTSLPLTETFKLQKYQLKKEAFNINDTNDFIYFYNQAYDKYVVLTPELYDDINSGKMRF